MGRDDFLVFDKFLGRRRASKASLKDYLNTIGTFGEGNESYCPFACELSLTNLAREHPELDEPASALMLDHSLPPFVRVNAFYFRGVLRRIDRSPDSLRHFLESSEVTSNRWLVSSAAFLHLKAYSLTNVGGSANLRQAIELAESAARQLPNNPGTLHQFAYTIVVGCEESIIVDESERKRLLSLASDSVTRAIRLNLYPTYLATRGRLMALAQRFPDAKDDLRNAVNLAREQEGIHPLRPAEFTAHLNTVIAEERVFAAELRAKGLYTEVAREVERVRDSNTRAIEFMAMFAAIISLIFMGVQISEKLTLRNSTSLLDSLLGVIVSMQASFMFLIYVRDSKVEFWRSMIHVAFLSGGLILLFRPWEWL